MCQAVCRFNGILALILALFLSGCSSSSDPVDEMSWRYRINSISVFDGDEERHEVDLTAEGSASVQVVVESNAEFAYDLFVHEINCDITLTSDSEGSAPATGSATYSPNEWVDGNGGTLTVNLIVLTAGEKLALIDEIGEDNLADYWADYSVNCTANGSYSIDSDDNQISVEDSTWFTVLGTSATPTPTPTPTP